MLNVLKINKIQGKAFRAKVYSGCKASVLSCITALLGTPLPSNCRWHISQSVVFWVLLQNTPPAAQTKNAIVSKTQIGQGCHIFPGTSTCSNGHQGLRSLSNVSVWCHALMCRAVFLSKQSDFQCDRVDTNMPLSRDDWSFGKKFIGLKKHGKGS